jgi:PAS domain S-box-containing protein
MTDKINMDENISSSAPLRSAAEKKLGKFPGFYFENKDKTPEEIIHEPQVHQVELEMQNDELKTTRIELEESRDKYQSLYDFAPTGYFTLTRKGIIQEVNLTGATLLGIPREKLIGRGFGHFVGPENLQQWYQHIVGTLVNGATQRLDIWLDTERGSKIFAHLESVCTSVPAELKEENNGGHMIHLVVSDITDRKMAEEALRKSEEKYKRFVETANEGFWTMDEAHNTVSVNEKMAEMLGYSPEGIIGRKVEDFMFADDLDDHKTKMGDRHNGQVGYYERRFRRKDGTTLWTLVSATAIMDKNGSFNGSFAMFTDITDRKRTEGDLLLSKAQLSLAQESAKAGAWEWNLLTNENFWSEELWSLYGLEPRSCEPSYEAWLQTIHPDDRSMVEHLVQEAASNVSELNVEWRVHDIKGTERWLTAQGRPVYDEHGQATSYIGIVMDITERKRLEAERLEMEREIIHAQKRESIGVMAGRISHDFSNQLAVILGNLELSLGALPTDSEAKASIMNAIEAANRSVDLSDQMLIYSGSAFYLPKAIRVNDLLNRTSDLFKSSVSKYVTLDLLISDELALIKGDADQIQSLVTNILVNASEAIGDKEGYVRLSTGVLDCDAAYLNDGRLKLNPEPGRFVVLEITDTGCGMDTGTLHRLFDPYFTTKPNNRGLGMAEVMGIVKGHHGALFVVSQLGKGTTIQVMLPVLKENQAQSLTDTESVETKSSEPAALNRRITILLVEDEKAFRDFTVRRLNALGYDTIIAGDGEQGVRIFRERLDEIDLVILDFAMPRMNGVEAFEELIRIKPDVKVILGSGYTEDSVLQSFADQYPSVFLHKPYNMEDLKREIERLLEATDSDASKDVKS